HSSHPCSRIHPVPTRRSSDLPLPPTVPPVGGEEPEGASHDGPGRVADPPRRGRHHPPHRTSRAAGRGGLSAGMGTRTYRVILEQDRKSTRLNPRHVSVSYAVS